MISEEQVQEQFDALRETIEPAARARAYRLFIEKNVDRLQALAEKEILETGASFDLAANALKREALARPEHFAMLKGLREAVYQDELMRNKRDTAKALIEAWRTQQATDRVSVKI